MKILSPAKLVLLAVHLASSADIESLAFLASQHTTVLRKDLVLRILLTYLPETVPSQNYVPLLQELASGDFAECDSLDIDASVLDNLNDDEATKRVRKLHLLPLAAPEAPIDAHEDPLALFLLRRAYRVDEEAGLLAQLPDLFIPFLHDIPPLRPWVISVLLPLLRRNQEYYPNQTVPYSLAEFASLPAAAAVSFLLSQTGAGEEDYGVIGRDMRGMIGPWLFGIVDCRPGEDAEETESPTKDLTCPDFEPVLEWLTLQASRNWRVAVQVISQWDGPGDVDLGNYGNLGFRQAHLRSLVRRYARAALASAYLVSEPSTEALAGAYEMVSKVALLLGQASLPPLHTSVDDLAPIAHLNNHFDHLSAKTASHMRNDLLAESNRLTAPTVEASQLLRALINSAFILTRAGLPCSVKRAGELIFIRDAREQKSEAVKLVHIIANRAAKSDDKYWVSARNELLWLQTCGSGPPGAASKDAVGVFSQVDTQYLETEFLKALLSSTRTYPAPSNG
jgi:hypothetical protein